MLTTTLLFSCASTAQTPGPESTEPAGENSVTTTVVGYNDYRDPLGGLNRAIFGFNDVVYRYALIPASRGYVAVTPQPLRTGIGNVFRNLKSPISIVNHLLQGQLRDSSVSLVRLGINSTVGLLGIFDPAAAWFDLESPDTGFNDTLTRWGTGYGIYLVLPLIGPSDLRSGVGQVGDYFANPIVYLTENPDRLILQGVDRFNTFAPQAPNYLTLRSETDDLYIYLRNMYLQGVIRDAEFQDQ